MKRCEHYDRKNCSGRITWEHVWIYAGKQINEEWAIIALCEYHHLGKGLDKDWNRYVSLRLAEGVDKTEKYPRKDWNGIFARLVTKFEG